MTASSKLVDYISSFKEFVDDYIASNSLGKINRVLKIKKYIDLHYHLPIKIESLSKQLNVSKYYFIKTFRRYVGITPLQYLKSVRFQKSKELLKKGFTPREACFAVGFSSVPSFYNGFKKRYALTPNQYIQQN